MKQPLTVRSALLLVPLLAVPLHLAAQPPQDAVSPEDLFSTIASLDIEFFEAYNTCDLEKFQAFLVEDLEFYHDQSGLTMGAQSVTDQVQANICGKSRRQLVEGSLEVYPIAGYGAVEIGVHRFYPLEAGSEATGEAKFIHLWRNENGAWRITRVISFDHVGLGE